MNKILIALYLLAILSLGDVVAQNSSYLSFANINPGTGASSISFIMQDHQGLMWIGSNKGLYSYDGYHFQAHYVFDEKSNTRIHCGVEVGKQYLYLGADNGVLIYNLQTDEYVNSPVVFPRDVRTMHLQDNHLWLGSLNGLYALDLNTNLLKHYDINHYPKLAHQAVYTIAPGNDHHLYIGTYNGLSLYSAVDDDFRSNLHKGGEGTSVKLTLEERKMAVRAARAMGLNVAGVDLMRSARGPLVLEVNASPGFGIEKVTGRDVATPIIEYIEQNAKRRNKKDKVGA